MKPATTLRELLKPPFHRKDFSHFVYNGNDAAVLEINTIMTDRIFSLDIRGQAQKKLLEYITQALNEKWERDFGGLKKWLLDDDDSLLSCPYCRSEYSYEVLPEGLLDWENYSFCPHCGRQLLPPEEEEQDESSL